MLAQPCQEGIALARLGADFNDKGDRRHGARILGWNGRRRKTTGHVS
jgi:hypothetical protein